MPGINKLRIESIIVSILPSVVLLLGLSFFSFSPLSDSKLVTVQNDALITFMRVFYEAEYSASHISSFLLSNFIFPLAVFLLIVSISFVINLFFLEKIDFKVETISSIILMIGVYVVTRSVIMTSTVVGFLVGSAWMYKTFEYKKNNFSSGYSFVSKGLMIMSIFLILGVLLTLSLIYDEGSVYDDLIERLEEYENKTSEQMESETAKKIVVMFPGFKFILKAASFFTALMFYVILSVLRPFVSILYGVVYSLLMKIKPKRDQVWHSEQGAISG